jgi:hypothetical protein
MLWFLLREAQGPLVGRKGFTRFPQMSEEIRALGTCS